MRRTHREMPQHLRGPACSSGCSRSCATTPTRCARRRAPTCRICAGCSAQAERLERAVGPIELVFGHNDLLAANFIDDGERLWLVDWDYAGFNSPLFDLGGLASNSEMPPEMPRRCSKLISSGRVADELRYRFAAMNAASLLRETMWSMVSEIHSQLDFDYADLHRREPRPLREGASPRSTRWSAHDAFPPPPRSSSSAAASSAAPSPIISARWAGATCCCSSAPS